MTYQALARKWRPRKFADVVGQNHVVAALTHALDNDRVHHAFLFTGTRGVGKTTLARLLAKSLNCEKGVSSTPCGECGACSSVEQGRFVDLLEIDAASRTRVDDTREILDNVQYAPTMGRYKVYLIDEVHMLSTHSFNALLKTLEEPPPHVKFVLATTDPQKLPPTILSRCLQFNLRALGVREIAGQLELILSREGVGAQVEALDLLARAADGSMRDALSLLDQAIAFSGQTLDGDSVRRMLGMIEGSQIVELLDCLVKVDTQGMFRVIDRMRERSINFSRALDDLMILLHESALSLEAPELMAERDSPWHGQLEIAARMKPEQVQLYYQIALIGKRDLPLAPDPARGFEMVMLRMLAFDPAGPALAAKSEPLAVDEPRKAATPAASDADAAATPRGLAAVPASDSPSRPLPDAAPATRKAAELAAVPKTEQRIASGVPDGAAWVRFAESGAMTGFVRELAMNLVFDRVEGSTIHVRLHEPLAHLMKRSRLDTLDREVKAYFGAAYALSVDLHREGGEADTPAVLRERRLDAEREEAIQGLRNDPEISIFIDQFDAKIVPETVRPAKHRGE